MTTNNQNQTTRERSAAGLLATEEFTCVQVDAVQSWAANSPYPANTNEKGSTDIVSRMHIALPTITTKPKSTQAEPHLIETLQLFQRWQSSDKLEARAAVLLDEVPVLVVLVLEDVVEA